jgi:hypothetical protein
MAIKTSPIKPLLPLSSLSFFPLGSAVKSDEIARRRLQQPPQKFVDSDEPPVFLVLYLVSITSLQSCALP